jgi:hypothetical protein
MQVKFALTKRLYEKVFDEIDWLIGLPKPLELEESTKMAYISSVENFAKREGRKEEKFLIAKRLLAIGLKPFLDFSFYMSHEI